MKKEALYLLYAEVIFEFTSWNYDSYKLPYPQDAQAARQCTVKKKSLRMSQNLQEQ